MARCLVLSIFVWCSIASAQESTKRVPLPKPDTTGGKPLMQVLKDRHSTRSFAERELPDQVLSNLLWAAFGVNRPDGRRTAPSGRNWQEIDLYLCTADGLFLYNASDHSLLALSRSDIRANTGVQEFVATAPLNIVYVADGNKISAQLGDDAALYMGADCGVIVQNVYLFCASEGLGTVVRAMVDRTTLGAALKLRPGQRIVLAQTIGYPK